jgi:AcrR family transcriptional regulator
VSAAPRTGDRQATESPASPAGDNASDQPRVRRRRDATRTRQDILVAAARHFARVGYGNVTMKDIADDIGVTPALVVRYFGTKLALFEEVAGSGALSMPPLDTDADVDAQLLTRARAMVAYFNDPTARAPGIALLRSLELDGGALFREQIDRRIRIPWAAELSGPDVDLRARIIVGLLLGVGLFTVGALTDPDKPPVEPAESDALVGYLARMLAVCVGS